MGTALDTLSAAQQLSLWLSQDGELINSDTLSAILSTVPASDLPEAPPALENQLFNRLYRLARCYLRELENSISIQQKLLPEQPPVLKRAEIAVRYLPKMGVSGDYYDFLPLHEGQMGLAIGDVCGKGMGAALLMVSVRATLRAQVQAGPPTAVGALLSHLNRVVHSDALSHQFVTLTYGIWDANSHTFTYSSAGHPPVLHYQAATRHVRELSIGDIVLGVRERAEYPTETVSLDMGDALVLYTDGLIEASDASNEAFGMDRLSEVVATHGEESSEALVAEILTTASQFAYQGWGDDVTVIVIKRIPMHS